MGLCLDHIYYTYVQTLILFNLIRHEQIAILNIAIFILFLFLV